MRMSLHNSHGQQLPGLEVNVRDILTVINVRSIEYKQLKETHPLIDDSNQVVNVFGYAVIWATRMGLNTEIRRQLGVPPSALKVLEAHE